MLIPSDTRIGDEVAEKVYCSNGECKFLIWEVIMVERRRRIVTCERIDENHERVFKIFHMK